ncbi:MAG: sigma-54-dependent Fis family transcriptional regulator [Bacteroidales bacterium]|nr:sigma-54-dependent Fis family transcriptional regulator [Bacteroidales bacterium]MBR2888118.1 sigma-54-dependent Fis family transcriptional regulator [Bacteroidales bacterium]
MELQSIKQRFGIIGNDEQLNRALDIAVQVAPTDISVLVTGESGAGKEFIPQVIHAMSARKHGNYIAVNCGAIPEGTIDSELFGHEKGSFTGANDARRGYFEVADKGTIFLDEVAELPLGTQVRLLRVLESKEFIRVGSSKVQKTDVRVVAATNVNMVEAVSKGRFREDLYYRLNTVQITMPPLRERGEDIMLLFRKFAADFAERYHMPVIRLDSDARHMILSYRWPGNVRQLKNVTEQISIIEQNRDITGDIISKYLPDYHDVKVPALMSMPETDGQFSSEREILYKVLFDMKNDINELKKEMRQLIGGTSVHTSVHTPVHTPVPHIDEHIVDESHILRDDSDESIFQQTELVDDSLSLSATEEDLIRKALEKYSGKRKPAAKELGISERTLYRKLKEYKLEK